jgi:ribosome-binding protein aMBF1 (putative translation factor)
MSTCNLCEKAIIGPTYELKKDNKKFICCNDCFIVTIKNVTTSTDLNPTDGKSKSNPGSKSDQSKRDS